MALRISLLLLLVGTALRADDAATSGAARRFEAMVFLRGFEVTQSHIVFGTIDHVSGNTAIVNMGLAHGLQVGHVFLLVRSVQGAVIPMGGVTVREAYADHANVRIEGPVQPVSGDLVLISAEKLDVWSSHTRADQLAFKRLSRLKGVNHYDTFNMTPALINEVHRDDDFLRRRFSHRHHLEFQRDAVSHVSTGTGFLGAVPSRPPLDAQSDDYADDMKEAATLNPTAGAVSQFVETARRIGALEQQLTFDRLRVVQPIDRRFTVTQDTTPALRSILIAWTRQVLPSLSPLPAAPASMEEMVDDL